MSRNYKFHNPDAAYFVSFAVIEWIDVFRQDEYKDILIKCLEFCQSKKGMEIFAWCIMPDHVHLVFRVEGETKPESVLADFKRYTSRRVIESLQSDTSESRKEMMIRKFQRHGSKTSNTSKHQFWQHDNQPIELWSNKVIRGKINYIHQNPVDAGLVERPEDYLYSSARDYVGETGLLKNVMVLPIFNR